MRNPRYKKGETQWDKEKYKRLTFKVDRNQYEQLTPDQQKTLSERVRQIIKELIRDYLKGGED